MHPARTGIPASRRAVYRRADRRRKVSDSPAAITSAGRPGPDPGPGGGIRDRSQAGRCDEQQTGDNPVRRYGRSTRKAVAGRWRWNEVLDAFQDRAERSVAAHSGRLVKTTGDGFQAGSTALARAIRSAMAVRDWSPSLGLAVRCGIHTAEIEDRGGDIAGVAIMAADRRPGRRRRSLDLKDREGSDLGLGDRPGRTVIGCRTPNPGRFTAVA